MALTTTGLTNGGVTTHYRFQYDDSLSAPINPGGPEPIRTNAVIAACEGDFNLISGWFGNIALDVNFTIPVNVTQNGGGASWSLGGGNLIVTINPSTGVASFVRYLLVKAARAKVCPVFSPPSSSSLTDSETRPPASRTATRG